LFLSAFCFCIFYVQGINGKATVVEEKGEAEGSLIQVFIENWEQLFWEAYIKYLPKKQKEPQNASSGVVATHAQAATLTHSRRSLILSNKNTSPPSHQLSNNNNNNTLNQQKHVNMNVDLNSGRNNTTQYLETVSKELTRKSRQDKKSKRSQTKTKTKTKTKNENEKT
jgi:hypothetical protein